MHSLCKHESMRLVSQPTYRKKLDVWSQLYSAHTGGGGGSLGSLGSQPGPLGEHQASERPVLLLELQSLVPSTPASDGSQPPMTPATGIPVPSSSLLGCHLVAYIPTDTKIGTDSEEFLWLSHACTHA